MTRRRPMPFGVAALCAAVIASAGGCVADRGATGQGAGDRSADGQVSGPDRAADRYQPRVTNRFGITITSAYDTIDQPRLSDRPYVGVPGVNFSDHYNYLGLSSVDDLAARSRIVVRATVTAIGRPHFNSSDGGFWHPALHDEPGVVDIAAELFRDVTVRVDEVLGTTDSTVVGGGTLVISVRGGQIVVELTPDTIESLELTPQPAYIFSSNPEVDLAMGEQAVLFLTYRAVDGLYDDRYGSVRGLVVTHELAYKFRVEGDQAVNPYRPNFTLSVPELRQSVLANLATGAEPMPPAEFVASERHPADG